MIILYKSTGDRLINLTKSGAKPIEVRNLSFAARYIHGARVCRQAPGGNAPRRQQWPLWAFLAARARACNLLRHHSETRRNHALEGDGVQARLAVRHVQHVWRVCPVHRHCSTGQGPLMGGFDHSARIPSGNRPRRALAAQARRGYTIWDEMRSAEVSQPAAHCDTGAGLRAKRGRRSISTLADR